MGKIEDELINRIRKAFAGVKLGDGISLNMASYLDSWSTEPECLEEAKLDERDDWEAIPDEVLEAQTLILSYADVAGHLFYLPAFMIWTLKYHEASDSIVSDEATYSLNVDHHAFKERGFVNAFTADQLSCMKDFLKYCSKRPDTLDDVVAKENLAKLEKAIANQ